MHLTYACSLVAYRGAWHKTVRVRVRVLVGWLCHSRGYIVQE